MRSGNATAAGSQARAGGWPRPAMATPRDRTGRSSGSRDLNSTARISQSAPAAWRSTSAEPGLASCSRIRSGLSVRSRSPCRCAATRPRNGTFHDTTRIDESSRGTAIPARRDADRATSAPRPAYRGAATAARGPGRRPGAIAVLRRYSPIAPAGVGMMLARRLGQAVILDLSRHLCRSAEAWRYVGQDRSRR